jgi:citronellol/citronellal dehydrogenase
MHPMEGAKLSGVLAADAHAGKVALVTGGGTGIGRACALQLGACGAAVAVLGRREEQLAETVSAMEAIGAKGLAVPTDIRDEEQVDAALATIKGELGRVEILVNNAGGQFVSPAKDTSVKGLNAVARLNMAATWGMTRAVALDSMIGQGGGAVTTITLAMQRGIPGMMAGVATRAAVHSMTRTLATEWARHEISLTCVAAGHVLTDGLRGYPPEIVEKLRATVPAERFAEPEEIASLVGFLTSPAGSYITGEIVTIDGGKSNSGDAFMIDPETT